MSNTPKTDILKSVTDGAKRMAIINAVASFDVAASSVWEELGRLSSNTEFEEIDAVPEGIFEKGPGEFEAVATIFVTLHDGDETHQSSMSDSYPAHVKGTYDPETGTASIDAVTVDTSSFYH